MIGSGSGRVRRCGGRRRDRLGRRDGGRASTLAFPTRAVLATALGGGGRGGGGGGGGGAASASLR